MQNGQSDMRGGHVGSQARGESEQTPSGPVSMRYLYQMAARAGRHYQLLGHDNNPSSGLPDQAVLNGQVVMQVASEALSVHTTDAVSEKNWTAQIDLPAGLIFCFVERGTLSFELDAKRYDFCADRHAGELEADATACTAAPVNDALDHENIQSPARCNCCLLYLQKPTRLTRFITAGEPVKKLTVTASRAWLMAQGVTASRQYLPMSHGDVVAWSANEALRQVALQLLARSQQADSQHSAQCDPPLSDSSRLSDNSPLGSLLLQGLATHCLAVAINRAVSLRAPVERDKSPSNDGQQRLLTLVDRYIHGGCVTAQAKPLAGVSPVETLTIKHIAGELGMSVSAVQRLAKQTLGDSLVNYIRAKKLDIARQAIAQGSMTIGEAAYHAGYKHSSNFAIAFKKAFGFAPGALQAHETIGD